MKILLGESAKQGKLEKVERVVARKDEILDALFERTYLRLSAVARRVFLTLSSWRSVVPEISLEAALLQAEEERIDGAAAVEELRKNSFVEISYSPHPRATFLSVPLVTSLFGKRKLIIDPHRVDIEADVEFLQMFGAMQASDVRHGLGPRIERFFKNAASTTKGQFTDYLSTLELLSRQYLPAWLMLASMYEESTEPDSLESAKQCLKRYLESTSRTADQEIAWGRLWRLCLRTGDWLGAIDALAQSVEIDRASVSYISNVANDLNSILRRYSSAIDSTYRRNAVRRVADIMEQRLSEMNATDCSRLAWLLVHLVDFDGARKVTQIGLQMDKDNEHCLSLANRLFPSAAAPPSA